MPAYKTWALAALGLAVSAPIDQASANEILETPTVIAPGGATLPENQGGAPSGAPAPIQEGAGSPDASPADSFITVFLKAVVAEGRSLRLPKLDRPELEESVRCLALNIYHEARSEPEQGQRAVAAVTLNRVASPAFPDSVCKVVKQGGRKRNRCQFSWWCDRHSDEPRETEAWTRALALSRKALNGEVTDPTRGALYYHATRVKPRWAKTFHPTGKIGQHVFYRPGV
jgi:Cell Wall Hydrolase